MSCSHSYWTYFSNINGSVSFLSSFISLFPQILETYRDKTVEGLSPFFLLAWLLGDITSLVGAILTKQLSFQIILALYFLLNDFCICCQYYYYGVLHQNKLATIGHESRVPTDIGRGDHYNTQAPTMDKDARKHLRDHLAQDVFKTVKVTGAVLLAQSKPKRARACGINKGVCILSEILELHPLPGQNSGQQNHVGSLLSWAGALFYVGARIPQLIKNYERKSTDGISPFLFATTLISNITYNLSIFTSCSFRESEDTLVFVLNELPFIIGSAGTVIFDLIYFYQHYVLYSEDAKLRKLEHEYATCSEHVINEHSALLN